MTARDAVVLDPLDAPIVQRGDVLLCVGLSASSPEACDVVEVAARAGAAAVVLSLVTPSCLGCASVRIVPGGP